MTVLAGPLRQIYSASLAERTEGELQLSRHAEDDRFVPELLAVAAGDCDAGLQKAAAACLRRLPVPRLAGHCHAVCTALANSTHASAGLSEVLLRVSRDPSQLGACKANTAAILTLLDACIHHRHLPKVSRLLRALGEHIEAVSDPTHLDAAQRAELAAAVFRTGGCLSAALPLAADDGGCRAAWVGCARAAVQAGFLEGGGGGGGAREVMLAAFRGSQWPEVVCVAAEFLGRTGGVEQADGESLQTVRSMARRARETSDRGLAGATLFVGCALVAALPADVVAEVCLLAVAMAGPAADDRDLFEDDPQAYAHRLRCDRRTADFDPEHPWPRHAAFLFVHAALEARQQATLSALQPAVHDLHQRLAAAPGPAWLANVAALALLLSACSKRRVLAAESALFSAEVVVGGALRAPVDVAGNTLKELAVADALSFAADACKADGAAAAGVATLLAAWLAATPPAPAGVAAAAAAGLEKVAAELARRRGCLPQPAAEAVAAALARAAAGFPGEARVASAVNSLVRKNFCAAAPVNPSGVVAAVVSGVCNEARNAGDPAALYYNLDTLCSVAKRHPVATAELCCAALLDAVRRRPLAFGSLALRCISGFVYFCRATPPGLTPADLRDVAGGVFDDEEGATEVLLALIAHEPSAGGLAAGFLAGVLCRRLPEDDGARGKKRLNLAARLALAVLPRLGDAGDRSSVFASFCGAATRMADSEWLPGCCRVVVVLFALNAAWYRECPVTPLLQDDRVRSVLFECMHVVLTPPGGGCGALLDFRGLALPPPIVSLPGLHSVAPGDVRVGVLRLLVEGLPQLADRELATAWRLLCGLRAAPAGGGGDDDESYGSDEFEDDEESPTVTFGDYAAVEYPGAAGPVPDFRAFASGVNPAFWQALQARLPALGLSFETLASELS
ncbi:hypothetical protein DIPPA_00164 [Diplonema papillatum]|nr:hypothetical protein DIPPA_00164 [Diplonema papillatum]